MSTLLNDNKFPQPAPQPDVTEAIEQVVNDIKNVSREIFNELVRTQRRGIELVWNHPVLTPQQVIDGLGEDAIKVFQFHGGLTDYIKTVAGADGVNVDLKHPTNAFSIDSNGSIVVSGDPYTIS